MNFALVLPFLFLPQALAASSLGCSGPHRPVSDALVFHHMPGIDISRSKAEKDVRRRS